MAQWLKTPSPPLQTDNASDLCWAQTTQAFLLLYRAKNTSDIERANDVLASLTKKPTNSTAGTGNPADLTCYWGLPILFRTFLHSSTAKLLTPPVKTAILGFMFNYVFSRSKVAATEAAVEWIISDSENHDVMRKSSYLLATQALQAIDPDRLLEDSQTVSAHYRAWAAYFKRHFSNRAMQGLQIEVASPIYEKYTLAGYFNIMDLSADPDLRAQAARLITLHWADVAQEFLLSRGSTGELAGIRGGATTRTYKNDYLTRGTTQSSVPLLYAYGWHDLRVAASPAILIPLSSGYEPPRIVKAIATDKKRTDRFPETFEYVSRRLGMGESISGGYTVRFDPDRSIGESNIRRQSYVTPDYVIGSMTWSPSKKYIDLSNQNRAVGVVFASHPDARIAITGIGEAQEPSPLGGKRTGYSEINAVSAGNCMIVARDAKARQSAGTQIFVSAAGGLWGSVGLDAKGGAQAPSWIVGQTGSAFLAIRPLSEFSVSELSDGSGGVIRILDPKAKIIVQLGRETEYKNLSAFKARVSALPIDLRNEILSFTSLQGVTFQVGTSRAPLVNGARQSLNPIKAYSSPYILGVHGSRSILLSHPDYPEGLELDFD
jgi:hypothetical protein